MERCATYEVLDFGDFGVVQTHGGDDGVELIWWWLGRTAQVFINSMSGQTKEAFMANIQARLVESGEFER